MQKIIRIAAITVMVASLLVIIYGVVLAKTINVDGSPVEWTLAERVFQEFPDPLKDPSAEIVNVFFTNDTSYLYWRFDTQAPTDWDQIGYLAICMDVQIVPGEVLYGQTGTGMFDYNCYADYVLKLEPGFGTAELWNAPGDTLLASAVISVASNITTTEIGLKLSDVGITAANCPLGCYVFGRLVGDSRSVFMKADGGGTDPNLVDYVPSDALPFRTFTARTGNDSPTVLTLAEMTARVSGASPLDVRLWAAVGVLIVGFVVLRLTGRKS